MMTNQLCVSVEQGSAGLEKVALSLPVPLKILVLSAWITWRAVAVSFGASPKSEVA
ncbi:hypothetical protein [Pseudomonas sp. NBRC 111144]|uniref:hypothetical protein n=1 Tax=Pseudomonas sp. NBRC 111144 TaxID=1661059 RepID=UPI000A6631C6|nr:hypothetical protein [Pseudomonas sp. NBRC 111144]